MARTPTAPGRYHWELLLLSLFLLPSLLFPVLDTASTSFPLALIYVGKGCQLHFTDEKLRLSDVDGGRGGILIAPRLHPICELCLWTVNFAIVS